MVPALGMLPALGGSLGVAVGGPGTARGMRAALTEGIPDPGAVQRQKETYARSLEDQLRKGVEVLAATHKQQTDLLHAQANQEKHRYNIALDQQVKAKELELSQQYNEQLMRLQQAAQVQRAELEQQACGITLEYQQRKVQEEYISQQQGIQDQHLQAQKNLDQEIQRMMGSLPGANALLERVQNNIRAGSIMPPPMAAYANPMMGVQPPGMPVVPSAMRPYVPPGTAPLAAAAPGRPMLSFSPGVQTASRPSLSFIPSAGVVAAPQQPIRSFVPPGSSRS